MKIRILTIGMVTAGFVVSVLVSTSVSPIVAASPKNIDEYQQRMQKLRDNLPGNFWEPDVPSGQKPGSQVVVQFNTSVDAKQEAVADKYNAETELEITPKTIVLDLPDSANVEAVAQKIESEPTVVSAEPDFKSVAFGQKTSWGYDTIEAAAALSNNSADGTGTIVAVLDTGVDYTHNELSGAIANNAGETTGNNVDDDGNGFIDDVRGWDFTGDYSGISPQDNDPMDDFGHGTHVSGIIAAANDADGVVGVAPNTKILPVKVLDSFGGGFNSSIAAGIRYAVDNGADVINMSLGSPVPSSSIKSALDYAAANDVVVVAAAGNEFGFNLYHSYPAAYDNVISVGASDRNDKLAIFSNWGKLEVTAPGQDILSTVPGDRTATYSGTSMASPLVAGTVALIKQKNPTFDATKIRHTLLTTANDQMGLNKNLRYGDGIIDSEVASATLGNSFSLEASSWRIISNNNSFDGGSANISGRLLDGSGNPVSGETINFSTDRGNLSAASAITDGNGFASVSLTADNIHGMATINASNVTYGSKTAQVLLLNNNVEAHEIRINKPISSDFSSDFPDLSENDTKYQPGESLDVVIELRNLQLEYLDALSALHANIDYQVIKESDSSVVSGLSGQRTNIAVVANTFKSINMTLPIDIEDGTYRFEATITDTDSTKTDQISQRFQIGGTKDLLIVPLTDAKIDQYNTDYLNISYNSLQPLMSSLDSLGESYDVWPYENVDSLNDSSTQILKDYPTVIFVGGGQSTNSIVEDYLALGGNAYLSGNTDFATVLEGSFFISGWCADQGLSNEVLGYSCADKKLEPTAVDGIASGIFDGKNYNISAFNFNSDGSLDNMIADELVSKNDAVDELEYNDGGVNSPAVAGFSRDDGMSRLIMTGFGVSAINQGLGSGRNDFVQTILNSLRPTGSFDITSVFPSKAYKGEAKTITISGEGFEATGATSVIVGGKDATDISVLDRNTLEAKLPVNLSTGKHDVNVTNSFGEQDNLSQAITISYRAPALDRVDPYFGANNTSKTITLKGKYFRSGAKVTLGTKKLGSIKVHSSKKITAKVPKDFKPGIYKVTVINSDGKKDSTSDRYRVRYGFRSDLSIGSFSSEVRELENRLQKEGYFPSGLASDPYFGYATRDALKRLQRTNGIGQTGKLDASTRNKLNTVWNLR